jgi:predicted dehydrogenase/nucleoside-diphosphate-sugar epimerase
MILQEKPLVSSEQTSAMRTNDRDIARSSHKRIRVAIIGCGAIAEQMHLPVLAGHEDIQLVALVDKNLERAKKFAAGYNVPQAWHNSDKLTQEYCDAVVLATPPALHARGAIELMNRGLHVLVEKPMALNLPEAEAMCAAAEKAGVSLAVGFFRRFMPGVRLLRAMLDAATWGRPLKFVAEGGGMYQWGAATLGNMRKDLAGGGVLIDFGSHMLDLLCFLFPKSLSVVEYRDNALGGIEADCWLRLTAEHDGAELEGTLELARTRNLGCYIRIDCEDASLEYQISDRFQLRVLPRRGHLQDPITGAEHDYWVRTGWQGDDKISWYETFRAQFDDWVDAIRTSREPVLSGRSALDTVRLIDECYRNSQPVHEPWVTAGCQKAQLDLGGVTIAESNGHIGVNGAAATSVAPVGAISRPPRVLVTGATGFIGARVAEILSLKYGCDVRALVHNPGNASRLARLPVEMVQGDLHGDDFVRQLVDGCQAVVHCAVGNAWGQRQENYATTVGGTKRLAECSLAAGVERMVHLSTISVYGNDALMTGAIDESTPIRRREHGEYGRNKAAAEDAIREIAGRGLSAVILRPARVYGPFSRIFVTRPIQGIARGQFRWIYNPDAPADVVYVDNVAEAIVCSLRAADRAVHGEAFAISEESDITWRAFYQYFADRLGIELNALVHDRSAARRGKSAAWWNPMAWGRAFKTILTSSELRALGRRALQSDPVGTLPRKAMDHFGRFDRAVRRMVGASDALPLYRREAEASASDWVEMGSSGALVSIAKARRLLGYNPPVSIEAGMDLTLQWIQHARLVG